MLNKNNKRKTREKKRKMSKDTLAVAATKHSLLPVQPTAALQAPTKRVSRLNQRLVVIVAVCSLLVAAGMHGIRHFQLNRNANLFLNRATSLQEEGKSREAIIYLSRYLRFRPNDVDARVTLGQLLEESSQSRRSWQRVNLTFEEVVRRDPSRSEIRRELVEVAVKLGRYGSALVHLEILHQESPDDGELAFLSAVCHVAQDNLEEAARFYCKSIEQSEGEIDHYVGFALFVLNNFDVLPQKGREVILKVIGQEFESSADEESPRDSSAEIVADRLLDFMVRRGQPAYRARFARAQFPFRQQTSALNLPLKAEVAANRATTVFNNLDTNDDNLLDSDEWMTAPFVPSMVDSNEDQKISYHELTNRFQQGADYARLDLARRDIQKTLALVDSKERSDVLRVAAKTEIALNQISRQQRKTDESKVHLQQAREFAEEGLTFEQLDLRFYTILSDISVLEGDLNSAEKHLRDALAILSQPEEKNLIETPIQEGRLEDQFQWALAELLFSRIESNQNAAGERELFQSRKNELADILKKLDVSQPRVKFLNGRMLFAEKHWRQASLRLEETRPDLEENVALRRQLDRILASCYQRLNNPDAQIAVFRRALREDPVWVDGHIRLGTALSVLNRLDEALTEYQSARIVPGVPTAMAGLLLRKLSTLPKNRREVRGRNIEQVLDEEARLSKKFDLRLPVDVPILRAELQIIQKNYTAAQDVLKKYLELYPEEAKIWAALSAVSLLNTNLEEPVRIRHAEQVLSQAQEKLGDRVEIRLAAMKIAVSKPVEEAKKDLETIDSETKNFEKTKRIQILQGLAAAYARISSTENVSKIWSQLAGLQPDEIRPWLLSAKLFLKEDDLPKCQESLQAIRRIEGDDGPNGNYFEALLLLSEAERKLKSEKIPLNKSTDIVTARALLTRAALQRPMWADVPGVLGHLENSLNNWDAAVDHFRTALRNGSRSKSVLVPLIKILWMQQRDEEADQLLRQLRNENFSLVSGELARIHSTVAWRLDQQEEALRIAVENADVSNEVLDKIFKAELLFASGQRGEEVEGDLREAVKIALEKQPEQLRSATFSLVKYLSKVDKLDGPQGADSAIAEAEKYFQNEPPALSHLTLGYCYEILHVPNRENRQYLKKAEEQYLIALNSVSNDSEIWMRMRIVGFYLRTQEHRKAITHLNQLLKSKKSLKEPEKDWANQQLAMIRAAEGGYSSTKIALEMLTTKDSDLRAKAVLLSRLPFQKDQRELIRVLERIEKTVIKMTQSERLQLAGLYELIGDWSKSREMFRLLLEDDPLNPQLIEYAVRAFLRHDHDEESVLLEVETLVDRLETREPDSFRTKIMRTRLLAARNQVNHAASLLNSYFTQNHDEQKLANLKAAASLLEELKQFQAADKLYREYAKLSPQPEAVLHLISFLGRRKKHADALDLCEKSWETVSTTLLATVAMAIIRDGKVTGRHVQLVEQRLKIDLEKDRNSLQLLLILADLRDYQGQFDQVESIYRRMLEIDQNNIVALNNYAWLKAIRYQNADDALPLIERAINRSGPISELLDTRAVVLLAANKPQEALKSLNEAIDQKPSPIKYFHLAQTHFKLSNYLPSKKALKTAEDEGLNWDQMHPLERKEWKILKQKLKNR